MSWRCDVGGGQTEEGSVCVCVCVHVSVHSCVCVCVLLNTGSVSGRHSV